MINVSIQPLNWSFKATGLEHVLHSLSLLTAVIGTDFNASIQDKDKDNWVVTITTDNCSKCKDNKSCKRCILKGSTEKLKK